MAAILDTCSDTFGMFYAATGIYCKGMRQPKSLDWHLRYMRNNVSLCYVSKDIYLLSRQVSSCSSGHCLRCWGWGWASTGRCPAFGVRTRSQAGIAGLNDDPYQHQPFVLVSAKVRWYLAQIASSGPWME